MQILLGVNETIIKINSSSIKIDYIQHFISTHFLDRTIKENTILIPKSSQNSYHRMFLLKWLYTLYTKRTKNILPELKDILVQRYEKAIKIELKEKIIHNIIYSVIDDETINIKIIPANSQIAYKIKTYLSMEIILLPTSLHIKVKSDDDKKLFIKFLKNKNIINVPHKHIYKQKDIEKFCNLIKYKEPTKIDKAYMILGLSNNYDAKSLKKQYKKLAKEFHPDRANSRDIQTLDLYTQKFQNILDAYEVLLKKIS